MADIMGVREEVVEATRFTKEPGQYTLGELATWSASIQKLAPFTVTEEQLISEQWVHALTEITLRQGLSNLGGLAYIVDQEAQKLVEKEQQK